MLFTSNAAKQLASTALGASKQAAREIGKKAIDVAKDTAVDAGKRLFDEVFLTPKNTEPRITQETKAILTRLINDSKSMNINNLMMGNGLKRPIGIHDLVRSLNGAGLKIA